MKHFKKTDDSVHAFDDDYFGPLITTDMTAISEEQVAALRAPSLAALKVKKNEEVNACRLAANFTTFPHAGKVFSCDALSRSDIDGANGMIANLGAMPPGWPGGWKAVDNTVLPIATVADWKAFYGSMFASGNANFIHAQDLKTALAAATTAAQVAAIVW